MSKRTILLLALGTLVFFSFLAWGIMERYGPVSLGTSVRGQTGISWQVTTGIILGLFWGFTARALVNTEFMTGIKEFFGGIIGSLQLSKGEIWFISCCAGIGEELLFRGALQPFLGVWWAAFLFVALHGYLTPFNWTLTVYGIFMVIAIATLGYAAEFFGLLTAVIAHSIIDVILLTQLTRFYLKSNPSNTAPE